MDHDGSVIVYSTESDIIGEMLTLWIFIHIKI